jgi:adenosine deaminase
MDKQEFYNLLSKIPKAEIHLHVEALITKQTISKILSSKDAKYTDINEVNRLFQYNNLRDFIKVFLLIQSAFEKIDDFKELFSGIFPYLKRNGIVHAELFFAPSNFVRNGIKFENIMEILIKEIERIRETVGINVKVIVDVSRTFGLDNALKNLEYVINCKCKNIIGIGLGGDEKKGSARLFEDVFLKAKMLGYHRVAHAGEDVGPKSIWDSINYLNVERIGHGISSIKDKKLINYLVENQMPLEICPTSNIFTGRFVKKYENHPIKKLFNEGVMVTLNTDDPIFFNIELIDEYWNLYSKLYFSLEDIKKIIINGFNASFITDKEKKDYINKVETLWNKYFKDKK